MEHTLDRVIASVEGAAHANGRRIDVLLAGPVPAEITRRVLLSCLVREVVADGEPADLAIVALEESTPIEAIGYLATYGCVLFDPKAIAPIVAMRRVRCAWVDQQPWVLPLEGPDAFREGVIQATAGMMHVPRISCSMPVNLEEHDVERVLASFLPIAQEWVVGVDTKSNDGTLGIVERYADVVFRFNIEPWSFAAARNATIEKCSFPWIFQTEGHEHLAPSSIGALRILLAQRLPVGMMLVSREVLSGEGGVNDQVFSFPWIFRNHPALRFTDQNGVHNALESAAYAAYVGTTNGVAVVEPAVRTIHKAHPENRSHRNKQRGEMNRKALDSFVDVAPNPERRARALFYAQQEHAAAHDWRKAASTCVKYLRSADRHVFQAQYYEGHLSLAEWLSKMGKVRFAIQILRRALPFDPTRIEAEMALGDLYQGTGDLVSARQCYAKCAGVKMPPCAAMFLRKSYYGAAPWKGLASVLYKMGDFFGAREAARAVLAFEPDNETCQQLAALELEPAA